MFLEDGGGFFITVRVEMRGSVSSSLLVLRVVVPLFLEYGAEGCFIFYFRFTRGLCSRGK